MGLDPNEVRSYLKIISVEWQNLSTKLNELEEELINSKNEIQELKKSEKTSVLICYADSLSNGNKEKTIKIFRKDWKEKSHI